MEKIYFFNISVLYLLQILNCMEPDGNAIFLLLC